MGGKGKNGLERGGGGGGAGGGIERKGWCRNVKGVCDWYACELCRGGRGGETWLVSVILLILF